MPRFAALAAIAATIVACSDTPSNGDGGGILDTGMPGPDITTFDDIGSPSDSGAETGTAGDAARDPLDDATCATLGCPCNEDVDCESGFCIESRDGASDVCSELCDDDCSLPGYECELLENSGGDAVRICVPADSAYCRPCDIDTDCGSLSAVCYDSLEGEVCATPCENTAGCPDGALCDAIDGEDGLFCVPVDGVCDGCVDDDMDGYGVGPSCLGDDPDDSDPTTYPGAPEMCDGVDNDGDGQIDEGVDNACGGCATLAGEPGTECGGECGDGLFLCEADGEAVFCNAEGGEDVFNACGGCGALANEPGDDCGECGGAWTCDGLEALICTEDTTDSDGDGVCDADDLCPGFDDSIDRDGDGVPDACADECPAGTYGDACAPCPPCERGTCDDGREGDGTCVCAPGFVGAACDRCDEGRFGADCAGICICERGVCDDGRDGRGVCGCEAGFTGDDCSECIDGRFGADCDGVCECGDGSCDDGRAGSGSCECPAGFAGPDCSECDAGRYGVDCLPCPSCDRGSCDEGRTGSGGCVCESGFTGSECSTCLPGRYGSECTACPACDRGTCDEGRTGTGGCTCDAFFTGPDCSECQDGFYGPECLNCPRCIIGTECVDGREGDGSCVCVPSAIDDRTCDGIDDDCDGRIDEDILRPYFLDSDEDGYGGVDAPSELACVPPRGFSATNDDCDDTNPDINPGAREVCNQVDDNCDEEVDNGAPASGTDASCNGVDDDCDGIIDDDYEPLPFGCCLPCGRGVYQEFETEFACIGGSLRCVPQPGAVCRDALCF